MALSATAATIAAVGSHSVNGRGSKVDKEELFPIVPTLWRGQTVRVQFEASRYTSSQGDWSAWRVFARDARADDGTSYGASVAMSDTMRRAVNEAGTALVTAWLEGETETETGTNYAESRARAFRHFLASKMTNNSPTSYGIGYAAEALQMHAHELPQRDRDILAKALSYLQLFRDTIDQLD